MKTNPARHPVGAVALVAGALLVGACGATEPAAGEVVNDAAVRAESTSSVADAGGTAPEATTPATLSSPEALVPGGWGPIRGGMTADQISALGFSVDIVRPAGPGNLCSSALIDVGGQSLSAQFLGDALNGVSVSAHQSPTPSVLTAEGLGVGDPVSAVTAAYPTAQESGTQVGIIRVITDPSDPTLAMSFTDVGGLVSEIRAGDPDYVKYFESCLDFSGTGS